MCIHNNLVSLIEPQSNAHLLGFFQNMDDIKKLRIKLIETELIAKNAKEKIFKHRDRLRFYSQVLLKAVQNINTIKLKIKELS